MVGNRRSEKLLFGTASLSFAVQAQGVEFREGGEVVRKSLGGSV